MSRSRFPSTYDEAVKERDTARRELARTRRKLSDLRANVRSSASALRHRRQLSAPPDEVVDEVESLLVSAANDSEVRRKKGAKR